MAAATAGATGTATTTTTTTTITAAAAGAGCCTRRSPGSMRSPAQERAIIAEVEKLQERLHGARRGLEDGRGDLAAAIRGPVLDDAALGAVLGRVDAATGEARAATLDALRGIHGVLDDGQRAQVADLLDQGGGWWRTGPYR